jgi:hypothetical protein
MIINQSSAYSLIKTSKCLRDTLRLVNTRKAWDHPITTEQGETLSE